MQPRVEREATTLHAKTRTKYGKRQRTGEAFKANEGTPRQLHCGQPNGGNERRQGKPKRCVAYAETRGMQVYPCHTGTASRVRRWQAKQNIFLTRSKREKGKHYEKDVHKKATEAVKKMGIETIGEYLHFSFGNNKMGKVPSVSMPPILTCDPEACKHCGKLCYAYHHIYKIYPSARKAYDANLRLYKADPAFYFSSLAYVMTTCNYFRVNVSGDIPDKKYFWQLVETIKMCPNCQVLMFTKRFSFINDYVANGGYIPANLHLIFSGWGDFKPVNPYGFAETNVIFKGEEDRAPSDWIKCTGNCETCAKNGTGCFGAKKGDTIAFNQH